MLWRLLQPSKQVGLTTGDVACRQRLAGMLHHYYRLAACKKKVEYVR